MVADIESFVPLEEICLNYIKQFEVDSLAGKK